MPNDNKNVKPSKQDVGFGGNSVGPQIKIMITTLRSTFLKKTKSVSRMFSKSTGAVYKAYESTAEHVRQYMGYSGSERKKTKTPPKPGE